MAENCRVNYDGQLPEPTVRHHFLPVSMSQNSQLFLAVRRVALVCLTILTLSLSSASAQEETPDFDVMVGVGGIAKLGHWLPVSFKVPEDSAALKATRFRVTVLDGDDTPSTITGPVEKTDSGFQGLIQIGKTYGDATFELLDEEAVLATVATRIRQKGNTFMELIPSTAQLYLSLIHI